MLECEIGENVGYFAFSKLLKYCYQEEQAVKTFPLTQTQLGMYLEWEQDHASTQYNVGMMFSLSTEIDTERLAKAISDYVALHPAFRLRLIEENGVIRQYIVEDEPVNIVIKKQDAPLSEMEIRSFDVPVDLFHDPFYCFELIRTPEKLYLLARVFHLAIDGTSVQCMLNGIQALYEGHADVPEDYSFVEYASHEPDFFSLPDYKAVSEENRKRFDGRSMTMPEGDVTVNDVDKYEYERIALTVRREAIERFCSENNVHPNLLFMGAYARLLAVYAHENDAVFFTVNHGRQNPNLRNTFGAFVKSVPVLGEINGNLPLIDYLKSFKLHKAGVYPFTHFCRDTGIRPGFGFVYQEGTFDLELTLDGHVSNGTFIAPGGASEYPMLEIVGNTENYIYRVTWQPIRYSQQFVQRLLDAYSEIVDNFVTHPLSLLKDIPLVSEDTLNNKLLPLAKGEILPYDRNATFVKQFASMVARFPQKCAVVDCEDHISYDNLNRQSDVLASILQEAGVSVGGFAGLMLPRRISFVISCIAVQKCGAGYVPLDAEYPEDRLAYMLENSQSPVLVTTHELYENRNIVYKGKVIFFDDCDLSGENACGIDLSAPDTPAYMIYTSGSTGRPKGVVLPNRALTALMAWFIRDCELSEKSVNACHPSFSFDASILDLFPTLAAGTELHLLSEETRKDLEAMRDYVTLNHVTGMCISMQMGLMLINTYPDLPLKYVMLGGEKMLPFAQTNIRILNGYGPTEFAVCSSYQLVSQSDGGDIPIGRAVPNTYSFVIDKFGQLVPPGIAGELTLAGPQMSLGYWQLPEKTAASFVACPILPGEVMYKTGDLARYNDKGTLDYLGRLDFQVKLRGFRIELGEIEHVASSVDGVKAVAAEVRAIGETKHLILYYSGNADEAVLKAKLSVSLTAYMVPDYFVHLDEMPLTPNGKINRKVLPLPEADAEVCEPPANDAERQVMALVAKAIGHSDFGVTQDLVRCGLTSLGAMSLIASLHAECNLSISVKELMRDPNVRAIASRMVKEADAVQKVSNEPVKAMRSWYPMTENQRGIYVDWMKNPDAVQYNVPLVLKYTERTAEELQAALAKVINVHPMLKTRFGEKNGDIVQLRRDDVDIPILIEALEEEPDVNFFARKMQPFPLQNADLTRAVIYKAPKAVYLFMDIHHIVFDGYSVGVIFNDLQSVLEGKSLDAEKYSAFDEAFAERDYLESEKLNQDSEWFGKYLDGFESTFFADSVANVHCATGVARQQTIQVPDVSVRKRCAQLGVTPNDYFLTVFTELLKRVGREEKVLINTVTGGRSRPETAASVGFFVRTLPFHGQWNSVSFAEAVRKTHEDMLELIDREQQPFTMLAEKYDLQLGIMFAFEGGLFSLPAGVEMLTPDNNIAKAPLAITIMPMADAFEVKAEYDSSRYSDADMQNLVLMMKNLALELAVHDDLRKAPLIDGEMAQNAMKCTRGEELAYDASQTVIDAFADIVRRMPDKVAVVDCRNTQTDGTEQQCIRNSITYSELDAVSNNLAHVLMKYVRPGQFVGVMLNRQLSFPMAAVAIQKAGAAYVPIDPEYPAERILYMLEDSCAQVLVTTRNALAGKNLSFKRRILFLEDLEKMNADSDPVNNATPDGYAYMIYTSGSTGKPKGVVIQHKALTAMLSWFCRDFPVSQDSVMASHPSFSFDASVLDMFSSLVTGAELHVLNEELRKDLPGLYRYIRECGITGMSISTQMAMALVNSYPDLPLKSMMMGGEKMLPVAENSIRLLNGYGPTEFTVCSSYELVASGYTGDIPIGRPVPNSYSFIVDRYGHLLPHGFPGEIALAGMQLAEGYWHLPERTAKSFVNCPMLPEQKMYRTGDLARYDDNGKLNYLGRLDFQVKLRGFRIEIGEIEHAGAVFPGVKTCAAEVVDISSAKHLVLYYEGDVDEGALKDAMASSLTPYMVPEFFVKMDAMPLTPNGKINRRLLPVPQVSDRHSEYVAPANDTERAICQCYSELLKINPFSAMDDFFMSGGNSLLAIQLVVALQKNNINVQYGDIFKYKTPRALANFLTGDVSDTNVACTGFDFSAFDYAKIDALLERTRTDLFSGFATRSIGNVLLTGVTGFLGIHILKYLLDTHDGKIYLLVRPKRSVSPERRVKTQYFYYFGGEIPEALLTKLVYVSGDLNDTDLCEKLSQYPIDTIINCAALVKHYVADDLMDRINVDGVANLIDYCKSSWARLIQISTYSIGGTVRADTSVFLDERHLYIGQISDNDYIRTKFTAERMVLDAVASGDLKAKIMRLGNLMGRESDGEFQINVGANAFVNSLKSYKTLGVFPLVGLTAKIEMSPIDRVAEAIVRLSSTPDDMVVFHPFNAYRLDLGAILGAMNRCGYVIDYVSMQEMSAHIDALRNDPERSKYLQGILHYTGHTLDGYRMTEAANDWTTMVLYRLGFRWHPTSDEYLMAFLNKLDCLGFFDV